MPGTDLGGVWAGFTWKIDGLADVMKSIRDVGARADDAGRQTQQGLGGATKAALSMGDAVGSIGQKLAVFGLAVQGVRALAGAFGWLATQVVNGNAQFETYETQLGVLLGGVDKARERMAELADFGQKTPFELPGIIQAEKILVSFGLAADDARQRFGYDAAQIRTIAGDVAAGTGSSFDAIAGYIGRFSAGATGEAIQRFQELGIVTRKQMEGVGIAFSAAGQMMTPVNEATEKLLGLMRDKFGGMMDAQSATFDGMISNLQDWAGQAKRIAAQPIFDELKVRLGELLTFLNQPETMKGLEDLARGVADALGQIVNMVSSLIGWFREVDPVALKMGASFVAVGLALPTVAAGITAIGAALTLLSINPIVMIAAGIVAAGLAIATVVDSANKKAAELSQSQSDMSVKIAQGADGYADYTAQMVAYLRESRNLPANYSDQQIAINAINDGIMVSEQNFGSYTAMLNTQAGPALQGLSDGMMSLRTEMDMQADSVDRATSAWSARMSGMAAEYQANQAAIQAVFTPDLIAGQLDAIAQITNDHMSRMQEIERQNNDSLATLRMNYLDGRAESEAGYQAQYQQMIDAGMTEEAAKLTAKHGAETAQNEANYQKQLQLQAIANIKQRIAQQQAYIQALMDQQDQTRRELMAQVQKATAEQKISATQQAAISTIIMQGASAKLKNEIEYAQKSLDISTSLANGQVDTAAGAMQALLDIQQGNIAGAQAAMAKLQADMERMMRDLIANTAVSTAGLAPIIGGAGSTAARAATEPATKSLSAVASDINSAIKAIKEAIAEAPSVIWTADTARAFDRVGVAIKAAVTKLYGWMGEKGEGTDKKIGDMVKDLAKLTEPMIALFKVLSIDTTKWKNTSLTFFDDLLDLVGKLKFASGEVYKWMALIKPDTRKALIDMQEVAGNVKALFDLIGINLAGAIPQSADWYDGAWRYINQLKWFSGRVYEWMQQIPVEIRASLEQAKGVAADVKELFIMLGIELSKAVPAGGDFFNRAWAYYGQLRWFSGRIYEWMAEIRANTTVNVADAAVIAKDMKELFTLLGVELEKAVPVRFRFKERAWRWYGQMRWISGRIYEWMMEIKKDTTLDVAAAALVAKDVKALFEILGANLEKAVPMGGVTWRKTLADYFYQLKEVGREIMNWLGYLSEKTRAQVAATAKTASDVKAMFELLSIDLSGVKPVGTRGIANIKAWFSDLKLLFADLMPELIGMNKEWGEDIDVVGDLVDKIATLFQRIGDASEAIAGARRVGGLHIGTARALLNQLMGILTYINQLSNMPIRLPPSIGGNGYVGGDPSDVTMQGGVVIQEQRIVLFENSPITVGSADELVSVVTDRISSLIRPLKDMGKVYALRGAYAR